MRCISAGFSHHLTVGFASLCLAGALAFPAALAQSRPEAKDMALAGSHDLQARSAYQPTIHRQGDRWIAYIGHHGGSKAVPKPPSPNGSRVPAARVLSGRPQRGAQGALSSPDHLQRLRLLHH